MLARSPAATRSRASSQLAGRYATRPAPFGPVRTQGVVSRSGPFTASR